MSVIAMIVLSASALTASPEVFFQAHRGGLNEVPENTMVALKHSWAIPGAVPEIDLRTTRDGVIVCMHDATPGRTTDADTEWADTSLGKIPFDVVKSWDAGKSFDARYAGTRVPTLAEVFAELKTDAKRQIYLDLKGVDLGALLDQIRAADVEKQIIFVHGMPQYCARLQGSLPGVRTMTWLSGTPEANKKRFAQLADSGFEGISQIQFHLHGVETAQQIVYELDDKYLATARETAALHGAVLQLRLFEFDAVSLRRLIDLGITWYVTDEPAAFRKTVDAALALKDERSERRVE